MFFENIDIQNFRGIKSLSMKNIRPVNLLTGRNNCGKTSILEAIFLLAGMSNPQLPINIHGFRNLFLTDDLDFSYLFRNFDLVANPKLSAKLTSQTRSLEIKGIFPTFPYSGNTHLDDLNRVTEIKDKPESIVSSNSSIRTDAGLQGLNFTFNIDDEKEFQTEIRLRDGTVKFSRDYKEKLSAVFINPETIMKDIDHRLDTILVKKEMGKIIDALKEIEPALVDIRMGARGMVYADIGIEQMMPINIMGDGIRRILAILAAIAERKNSILLIDEIENGLHYSTIASMWKTVLKMAYQNGIQLFITTHSYECVEAMVSIFKDEENLPLNIPKDFISLYRIDRDSNGQHRALQYETDTLIAGVEKGFEVR